MQMDADDLFTQLLQYRADAAASEGKLADAKIRITILEESTWLNAVVVRKAKDGIERALYHLKNDESAKASNELHALLELLHPEQTQERTFTMTEPPPPYGPVHHNED